MYVRVWGSWMVTLALLLFLPGAHPLSASTIEVEEGGGDNASTPAASSALTLAPASAPSTTAPASQAAPEAEPSGPSPATVIQSQELLSPEATNGQSVKSKRTRASQGLSFYSFLSAGFVVSDSEPGDALGKVVTATGDPMNYSQPSEAHVELVNPSRSKVGDLWTVYHLYGDSLTDPDLNFQGSWADILAVVQVEEIIKNIAKVKIIQGFNPFAQGDQVQDYGLDVRRWKRTQVKKNQPLAEIRCYVAGGQFLNMLFKQSDSVVLTAGTRRGVVEGMIFNLHKKTDRGVEGTSIVNTVGTAEVFYCGTSYSLARITQANDANLKGCTAIYRP